MTITYEFDTMEQFRGFEQALEKSASVPDATVEDILEFDDGEAMYELAWSNGNTNRKTVREIDRMAVNANE